MADCRYFSEGRCRSCSLLEIGGTGAANLKFERFRREAARIFPEAPVRPIYMPSAMFSSRAKAKISVTGTAETPILGLIDSDFNGIELLECPLHFPELNGLLNETRDIIRRYGLTPYDIRTRTGELKGAILTSNADRAEMMARFVLRSRNLLSRIEEAAAVMKAGRPELKVVSVNLQPVPHAILEGPEERIIGEGRVIWERYDRISVAFGPKSFMQVTPETATELYAWLRTKTEDIRPEMTLDLFCGSGGFMLHAARFSKNGLGLEISTDAIECARLGADRNGFSNIEFEAANLLDSGVSLPASDLVIVNPPRRGIGVPALQLLRSMKPEHIFYSSCNPATLFSDALELSEEYAVAELAPFDMFPMTAHMEVAAHLVRRRVYG